MSDPRVPHFLRVTRALALVSGLGLPAAATTGCGGAVSTSPTSSSDDSGALDGSTGGYDAQVGNDASVCSGICGYPYWLHDSGATGVMAYDGGTTGVTAYDGGSGGVMAYDGGSSGGGIYDGAIVGVRPYDGGPLGIGVAPDGGILVGGPLIAPELPV